MEKPAEKTRALNLKGPDSKTKEENKLKSSFKMYNTTFHGFGYEHTQKQKRTFVECENSTPSELSDQSFNGTTDVFFAIPLLKQIVSLGECVDEHMITAEEMIRIFTKLKISQACDGSPHPFKYFPYSRQVKSIKVEELVAFLTSDIKKIQLGKYSKEEAVLKIGLEIFRAVSKENISLEIRHLISYMKEHKKIDIDMVVSSFLSDVQTNMLEMFDFFANANSGLLKARTNVVSFFARNASKLARTLSLDFMAQIQLLISSKKGTSTTPSTQTNSISTKKQISTGKSEIIKIYDPNLKANAQQPVIIDHNILAESRVSRQEQSPIKIIRVETHQNEPIEQDYFNNLDITEVFSEILPKNRGWLMRKSNKKANKWSMVFYEITNDKLISYKPEVLKKTILVKNIEIHKCNFLEIINRFEGREHTSSKTHKRSNSKSKNSTKEAKQALKEDILFFILDKESQKTYLIKSPDNMIIGSIIHFYLLKENPKKQDNAQLISFLQNEPEYSGVIEVAICKKKSIGKYHSSLKSYSFKKQFLIIKQGKFNVYDMKVKDSINLIEYETKVHNTSDLLIPQTNPHCFSLTKLVDYNPYNFVSPKSKNTLGSFHEPEVVQTLPDRKKPNSFFSKSKKEETAGNAHYEDLVIIEEKKPSFFSGIFKKFSFGKKKSETIILSCDTEIKRRQWLLTIGFFTQMAMKTLHRSKMSFTKESVLNTNEDQMLRSSFGGENYTYGDDGKKRNKSKNKNSISIKQKVSHNPDFFDVYKNDFHENKDEQLNPEDIRIDSNKKQSSINQGNNPIPLMTEPDAENHLDSEEVLMTFTHFNPENLPIFLLKHSTLGNKVAENYEANLFSNEIKSVSDVEIWQKFVLYFIQENHSVSEFDMAADLNLENTTTLTKLDIDVPEECDGVIRPIALSDWSIRKNR